MSIFNISNRYASALFRLAEDSDKFDKIAGDMDLVFNTLEASKELRNLLVSPVITEAKKKSILSELFDDKVSAETQNFLKFVVTKNREDMLFDISKRFIELRDDKLNIVNANISTAVEVTGNEKKLFEESLASYTGKKVRLNFNIDEKIIGGFRVKIKDKLIDASVFHQLELLRKRLVSEDRSLVN